MRTQLLKRTAAVAAAVLAVGALGVGVGAAVASVPVLLAPAGLSSTENGKSASKPAPSYAVNDAGQTYGSAALATSPFDEPDLIRVVSDKGAEGYVLKVELDEANGAAAAATFKTPEQALAWQAERGAKDVVVAVYLADGKTPVGTFTVQGSPPNLEK